MQNRFEIAIVGAGLAGIACAIRLRSKGYSVVVLEKNGLPGGKLSEFEEHGFRFDKGPSLFTEPEQIDELFQLAGKKSSDYFNYSRMDESCRYFFSNGKELFLKGELNQDSETVHKLFNSSEAEHYENYLRSAKESYESIGKLFIDKTQPRKTDFLRWEFIRHYPKFASKKLRKSLHDYNESCFDDPGLIQLFDRYGTYNGSNPYKMNGIYSMIPHLELNKGTFFPSKGMRTIIDSTYQLAVEMGVEFKFNQKVSITTKEGEFSLQGSEEWTAKKIVSAIDHLTFYRDVIKNKELTKRYSKVERSTSGLVFFFGVNCVIPKLGLHNILFSENYKEEFKAICEDKKLCEFPTFYVHISSVAVPSDAPENCQNLFVMVNTPAGIEVTEAYKERIRRAFFKRLELHTGITIESHLVSESNWATQDIESITGSFQGAIYGPATNHTMDTFKRHGNVQKTLPNVYFCGGTVHPGGGIPLVLRSAKIVEQLITNDEK